MSTIKLDYGLCETSYTRSILPEGNRLKENFYAAKSMMKPLNLGYQKIVMCPNFCMLYYLENAELTELAGERLLEHIKNLDTSQSHLDCRDYSCHKTLLST